MSSDKDIFARVVNYMNEQRPETLLLFAWNIFGFINASQASMVSIDSNSFTLVIKNRSFIPTLHHTVTKVYKFNPPLLNASESRDRLVRLSDKYSYCPFPTGIFAFGAIALWVSLVFALIQAKELLRYSIIQSIHNLSLKLYGSSENAAYGLALLIIIHCLELVYMLYIFRNLPLPANSKASWINKMVILGLPVTMQANTLTRVMKKQSKKTV